MFSETRFSPKLIRGNTFQGQNNVETMSKVSKDVILCWHLPGDFLVGGSWSKKPIFEITVFILFKDQRSQRIVYFFAISLSLTYYFKAFKYSLYITSTDKYSQTLNSPPGNFFATVRKKMGKKL